MAIHVDKEVRPLTEFQGNVAVFLKQLRETHRPIVLTEHDQSVAVLMDAGDYAALHERLALLEDLVHASEELDAGKGIPHEEARAMLLKRFGE